MIGAAVDLGSNSFICLIFEGTSAGSFRVLHDELILTRMSEGVDVDQRLSDSALQRAREAFKRFSQLFQQYEVEEVLGVATSAVRDAKNQKKFLDLAQEFNIPVQILSGVEEAQMTFAGVKDYFTDQAGVVVDIGGGSTEYIYAKNGCIEARESLNMGAVRFTERFKAFESFQEKEKDIRNGIQEALNKSSFLKELKASRQVDFLLAVSGTPTNAAALALGRFNDSAIEGFVLTAKILEDLNQNYAYLSLSERLNQFPFVEEKRADVLPAGLAILYESMKFFGLNSYCVSTRGIRHGVAKTLLGAQ